MLATVHIPPRDDHQPLCAPANDDEVTIEQAGRRIPGVVVDHHTVLRPQRRRSALRVVVTFSALFELDGERLGRFRRRDDDVFELVGATAIGELAAHDRTRVVRHWLHTATTADKRGEIARVIDVATRILVLGHDDDRVKALHLRAGALAAGDPAAALADWDMLLALRPTHHRALLGRARVLSALGDRAAAIADVRRAVELGVDGAAAMLEVLAPSRAPTHVTHRTYGVGKVVRRLDGDKLEVEFASGTKTLLARFVETVAG